jgi:Gpi18-like mannosyltransferase
MIAASFIIRLLLFPLPGYKSDTATYQAWFQTAANVGLRTFYSSNWSDYPPFNIYLFWGFGSLAKMLNLFGTASVVYPIKLVPNIFDIATALLIFAFTRKRFKFKTALLATALYTFNPAVIFNTAVWGQYDAIYTFFLVLSVMLALASKPEFSAIAFTFGILTKPQGIALAPLIAFLILKKYHIEWRRILTSLVAVVATVFLVIIPFEWSNPINFLYNIYFGAYGGYAVTTVNAFNIWALVGFWIPDTNYFVIGWILFTMAASFTLYVLYKRSEISNESVVLLSAFLLFFSFFMLPTRIHERYLFPAMSILALLFPFIKKTRPLYVVLTGTCLVNQAYVLYWLNAYIEAGYNYSPNFTGDPVAIIVTLINLVTFLYALILMKGELKGRLLIQTNPASPMTASGERRAN